MTVLMTLHAGGSPLTMGDLRVLRAIARGQGAGGLIALGAAMGAPHGQIKRHVDRLCDLGFATSTPAPRPCKPGGRRVRQLAASERGLDALRAASRLFDPDVWPVDREDRA